MNKPRSFKTSRACRLACRAPKSWLILRRLKNCRWGRMTTCWRLCNESHDLFAPDVEPDSLLRGGDASADESTSGGDRAGIAPDAAQPGGHIPQSFGDGAGGAGKVPFGAHAGKAADCDAQAGRVSGFVRGAAGGAAARVAGAGFDSLSYPASYVESRRASGELAGYGPQSSGRAPCVVGPVGA